MLLQLLQREVWVVKVVCQVHSSSRIVLVGMMPWSAPHALLTKLPDRVCTAMPLLLLFPVVVVVLQGRCCYHHLPSPQEGKQGRSGHVHPAAVGSSSTVPWPSHPH